MSNQKTGLFLVSYEIGNPIPGAVSFRTHLSVFTPEQTVSGAGRITQAINPPLNVATILKGDYTDMTVMPDNTRILVVATGYAPIDGPGQGGITPITVPNVELRMVLQQDWNSGVASYKYRDSEGTWHTVENAPVKSVQAEKAVAIGK